MMDDSEILKWRGRKRQLDPWVPFGVSHDIEPGPNGPWQASTVFLTGKECPFRCLMCDLWKYTLDGPTPEGAIVAQLQQAIEQIDHRDCIKLYNASNFFDAQAVPRSDHERLIELLKPFKCVVVENHPKLTNRSLIDFAEQMDGRLQVAMGLETANPAILKSLNKRMCLDDFTRACDFLLNANIGIRTFVVYQLPGVCPAEAQADAVESVTFAYSAGADYCSLIPLRKGNGAIDHLIEIGEAELPRLNDFLTAATACLEIANQNQRSLLVDLWDLEQLSTCETCFHKNLVAWANANQEQRIPNSSICPDCGDCIFGVDRLAVQDECK